MLLRYLLLSAGGVVGYVLVSDLLIRFFNDFNVTEELYNWLLSLLVIGV